MLEKKNKALLELINRNKDMKGIKIDDKSAEPTKIRFPIVAITQVEDKGMHVQFDKKEEFIRVKSESELKVFADMDLALIMKEMKGEKEENRKKKQEIEKIET